jgi:hypothetical protein
MTSFKQFLAQNNPDLLPEELQQVNEISAELAGRAAAARVDRNTKGPMSRSDHGALTKHSITPLDKERNTLRRTLKKPGGAEAFLSAPKR